MTAKSSKFRLIMVLVLILFIVSALILITHEFPGISNSIRDFLHNIIVGWSFYYLLIIALIATAEFLQINWGKIKQLKFPNAEAFATFVCKRIAFNYSEFYIGIFLLYHISFNKTVYRDLASLYCLLIRLGAAYVVFKSVFTTYNMLVKVIFLGTAVKTEKERE